MAHRVKARIVCESCRKFHLSRTTQFKMIGGESIDNVIVLTLVVVGIIVILDLNRSNRTWMYFILSAFVNSF